MSYFELRLWRSHKVYTSNARSIALAYTFRSLTVRFIEVDDVAYGIDDCISRASATITALRWERNN